MKISSLMPHKWKKTILAAHCMKLNTKLKLNTKTLKQTDRHCMRIAKLMEDPKKQAP